VGLEGVLLTRLPSSIYLVDVPYSGEDELGLASDGPAGLEHGLTRTCGLVRILTNDDRDDPVHRSEGSSV